MGGQLLPWFAPWEGPAVCGSAAESRRGFSGRSAEDPWAKWHKHITFRSEKEQLKDENSRFQLKQHQSSYHEVRLRLQLSGEREQIHLSDSFIHLETGEDKETSLNSFFT